MQGIHTILNQWPLFWLLLTFAIYMLAERIQRRFAGAAWLNPVLLTALLLGALLLLGRFAYSDYQRGVLPLQWLLGPATVALAVPLAAAAERIRRLFGPLMLTLGLGMLLAIGLTIGLSRSVGLSTELECALLPRSITTPIAVGVADALGAAPSLTAALVIATGIIGAGIGPALLAWSGVRDPRAIGFALGMGAHGIGVSQALRMHAQAGVMAGLAMGMHGFVGALLVPLAAGPLC